MLLRSGPFDGHKVDGRKVRSLVLWMRGSSQLAANEIAEYWRSAGDDTHEFVRTLRVLLHSSSARQRLNQLCRSGLSYNDALAQPEHEHLVRSGLCLH